MSPGWQALVIALWVVVLVEMGLLLALYRQVGIVYLGSRSARARDGLDLLREAPDWEAEDYSGARVGSITTRGRPLLLVFAEPNCSPCQQLMPELKTFTDRHREELAVVVVGASDDRVNRQMADRYLLDAPVVSQADRTLSSLFNVSATPFIYFIDEQGVIREKGIVNTQDQLEQKFQAVKEADNDRESRSSSRGKARANDRPKEVLQANDGLVVRDSSRPSGWGISD
jgi:methylamine dehydrogenase accessory protein MauD